MSDTDSAENERKEPNTTTLTLKEWIEELNTCDRLHQYAKKRREETDDEQQQPTSASPPSVNGRPRLSPLC